MQVSDKAEAQNPRKKRRLNRPTTSCTTCRRLKTRCEIVPGRKACQRCTSLHLDCSLPVVPDADDISVTDNTPDTDLQLRLSGIEHALEKLTSLVQTVLDHSIMKDAARTAPNLDWQPALPVGDPVPPNKEVDGERLSGVTRPVLLVRNLQTQFFGPKRDFSEEQSAVGSVVSAGIIMTSLAQSLIRICTKRIGHWVSIMSLQDLPPDAEQRYPLLFSTMCLLAARHLPSVAKAAVHDMYMLVRRLVSSVVLMAPPLDYETLQALTLLSLFTPTIQTAMPIDSWIVSSLAMNHAALAFGFTSPNPVAANGTEEQLRRLRVWNAVCLTQIQFAIGNGRPSMVKPRFVEQCSRIVDFPSARTTDGMLYAEVLLYFSTESILTNGLESRWDQPDKIVFPGLVEFKCEWGHLFDLPECVALKCGYWYSHLLLYRACLRAAQPESEAAALRKAALAVSSTILELFLDQEFSVALDMPDHFFFIIIYAGLTMCKFAIGHHLIAATQHRLADLAPNDEHIAYRFSIVLAEIRKKAAAAGVDTDTGTIDGGRSGNPHGDHELIPPTVDFLPGNDDYTWDAFLGWSTMTETGMGLSLGLNSTVSYGLGAMDSGFRAE